MHLHDDLTKVIARLALADNRAYYDDVEQFALGWEAQGYRIIGGGQVSGWDYADPDDPESSVCSWEYIDRRTGEVLCAGTGTMEDEDAAMAAADPDGHWFHEDRLCDEPAEQGAELVNLIASGVPASLVEAITTWALEEDIEEIAAFIGWALADVRACRDEHLGGVRS